MPAKHRPNLMYVRVGKGVIFNHDETLRREIFMWPHINQEDLASSKTLLLLLNARSRHCPSHFAAADSDSMKLGFMADIIKQIPLSGYVVLVNDVAKKYAGVWEQLTWLLTLVYLDQDLVPQIVDELKRMIQSSRRASDLVYSKVAESLRDLSILAQCRHQLDYYFRWSRAWNMDLDPPTRDELIPGSSWPYAWIRIRRALVNPINSRPITRLARFFSKPFPYPINKCQIKENVQALRTAEKHLDTFWAAVDKILLTKALP
ncbi:hypothetical protein BDW74DRAFT_172895 [Aspergillus multicolor]|uniref:uncharacterized protein n=1 Tax=Aspergillus multicolor TaxID=41759 RepID=UPI003CCDCDFC